MYVKVRSVCQQNATITLSKVTTIEQFKESIEKVMGVKKDKQRLFFRGKQLEDGYSVFHYNLNVNDVVQLMIKPDVPTLDKENKPDNSVESHVPSKKSGNDEDYLQPCDSAHFRIGDSVDARDMSLKGAWFQGKIIGIYKDLRITPENEDCLFYKISLHSYPAEPHLLLSLKSIRPMARNILSTDCINSGDIVMVNYNIEEPEERGYWYDLEVTNVISNHKKKPVLMGTLFYGRNSKLDNIVIQFVNEIMKIEPSKLLSERTAEELELMQADIVKTRTNAHRCQMCSDNQRKKCKECGCHVCGGKKNPDMQVICDDCDMSFHISCLKPPLKEVPDDDQWFCDDCKIDENEVVKAGEKLKESKKKAKMASTSNNSSRNWGKGMACVGRTKECTIVPPNHFGPIPGIEVGSSWKYRVQVSEAGVHRPHVAGIHGREREGAFSLVLSGGYEDDVDSGDNFFYTGSGGRDLSGNSRTGAEQTSNQRLTRMNKALALNCNAPLNTKKGAEAKNWREGKPVRVVRSSKLGKHSMYAPEDGNRYDGIYKVVKYYPEKGKSGYIIWRYLLKRDDPTPAPWTPEGKARMESLGLEMVYPEGFLAAMGKEESENSGSTNKLKKHLTNEGDGTSQAKKPKMSSYQLDADVEAHIVKDTLNAKLWKDIKSSLEFGKKEFLSKVEETFMCVCCQELVYQPVTTPCIHNMCLVCLQRSFNAEVYTCPTCRTELGKKFAMEQNRSLQAALLLLLPGHTAGR